MNTGADPEKEEGAKFGRFLKKENFFDINNEMYSF